MSKGTAPREGSNESQAVQRLWTRVSHHLSHRTGWQALPVLAPQLSLSNYLPHLQTLLCPSFLPREDCGHSAFSLPHLSHLEGNPSLNTEKSPTGKKLKRP